MPRPEITFDSKAHKYTVNGEVYPSVTRIIAATVPKDLSWWGMTVGIEAVWTLLDDERNAAFVAMCESADDLVELVKTAKLTTNHQMRKAGGLGTTIHKMLEDFGNEGTIPDPLAVPEDQRPRVFALAGWLVEARPEFLGSEVRTASVEHRYAGTFDLRARLHGGPMKGKVGLIDLKNTKHVYPDQHFPQLEAYEQAEVESGERPSDFRAVLHLPPRGSAQLVPSTDTFRDFKVLLDHFQTVEERKCRLKSSR